jgi:hypothetical protein
MEEVTFINNIINYRGYDYSIGFVELGSDISAIVNLLNDPYTFNIALFENETTINGVLQTSAQMIFDTLTNA